MRTTVTLDDDLMERAAEYSGLTEKSAIIQLALKSYIAREAGRRLAGLGRTARRGSGPPRQRRWCAADGAD